MAEVILKNVEKVYPNGYKAISDINLEIHDKELLVLVGPSGCGKSTILRIIAGLEDVTNGQVIIGRQIVNKIHPKERDIAMVFQNYALYPHMSVYDNIAFGLRTRKYEKNEINKLVIETTEMLGIDEYLKKKPRELSGGERQRVAIGRAIVRHPQVFLFDEPLSNLDAKMRVAMRAEISKLHTTLETTMIYVTHDQTEAMTLGDRIVVLDNGDIMQIADPQTLYFKPENIFVAGFIGSPQMNFFEGNIENHIFKGDLFDIPINNEQIPSSNIVIGIRPENFSLNDGDIKIGGKVDLAESLGDVIYLYVKTENDKIIILKTDGKRKFVLNENITIYANKNIMHYLIRRMANESVCNNPHCICYQH